MPWPPISNDVPEPRVSQSAPSSLRSSGLNSAKASLPQIAPFRLITVKGGGLRPGVAAAKLNVLDEIADVERWTRRRR